MSVNLLKDRRRTVTRDLIFGLVIALSLGFGLVLGAFYFYTISSDSRELSQKAQDHIEKLAEVLSGPVWNLDLPTLRRAVDVFSETDFIANIYVYDEQKTELYQKIVLHEDPYLTLQQPIFFQGERIGSVAIGVSRGTILRQHQRMITLTLLIYLVVTFALVQVCVFLLKHSLYEPFKRLRKGLQIISSGNYRHRLEAPVQEDLAEVIHAANTMAADIAQRQEELELGRQNLQSLNRAILDLFSCANTQELMKTTLTLTHVLCGTATAWFKAQRWDHSPADESGVPVDILSRSSGEMLTADLGKELTFPVTTPDLSLTFSVQSRNRKIGDLFFTYLERPAAQSVTLLNTLVALVNQAMVRQSLIRESAFISAELRVAEAVQKAMLPVHKSQFKSCDLAFHYKPVLRVGGDWLNIIEAPDRGAIYIVLGDVTGHGLAQGLVTTAVTGAMQSIEGLIKQGGQANPFEHPSQMVKLLDDVVARIAGSSSLRMTCVALKLDTRKFQLEVCNAGHTFPIVISNGQPLGVKALVKNHHAMLGEEREGRVEFTDASYDLRKDDVLLVFTDGLMDGLSSEQQAFSRVWYRFLKNRLKLDSAQNALGSALEAFEQHTHKGVIQDDYCLVALRV